MLTHMSSDGGGWVWLQSRGCVESLTSKCWTYGTIASRTCAGSSTRLACKRYDIAGDTTRRPGLIHEAWHVCDGRACLQLYLSGNQIETAANVPSLPYLWRLSLRGNRCVCHVASHTGLAT